MKRPELEPLAPKGPTLGCAGCEHHGEVHSDTCRRTLGKIGDFTIRMMPGDEPYTPKQLDHLRRMMRS